MIRILLVDDDPDDRLMVKRELSQHLEDAEFEEIRDSEEFQEVLHNNLLNLVITDYQLRWSTGLDVLKEIKNRYPDVPVIMFTGTGSEEVAVEAMKAGLDDYVLKSPKHFKRLGVAVLAVLKKEEYARRARESEARYRDLFNRLPVCIYRSTIEGEFVEVNPAGLKMLGCKSPEDIRCLNIKELYVDATERDALIERLNRDGVVTDFRTRLKRIDGIPFFAEIHATIKKDNKGMPLYVEGIMDDITPLVKAEEERLQLFQILSTLFEHLPEGVFLLDKDGNLVHINPLAERYIEEIEGTLPGKRIKSIHGRAIEEYLVSPPNFIWHEIQVKGPEERIFQIGGRRIVADSKFTGMVFLIRDVTEERKMEERIQIQERLAAVGQLAAGIAHDFNNILTGIIGYAEMLEADESLPYAVRRKLEVILRSGQRAATMIKQILDFTRKSVSEMTVFDLVGFMKEFMRFVTRVIPENIKVHIETEQETCHIRADPAKMQQVFTNLAVNSRDAMPDGGTVTITIQSREVKEPPLLDMKPGEWVVVTFKDTGPGIPSEVLPHIFEPFFTTKGMGVGTGLGLSQVYGIIRQHGGFIDVKSDVGVGTSFIIYLPACKDEAAVMMERKPGVLPEGHGETILVVEDDENVRGLVLSLFSELNYRIISVHNGKEALEVFNARASDIDMVITDLVMPEMGGMELCQKLKEIDPDVKIVALSGYPLLQEDETLMKECFDKWIQKPFNVKDLAETVSLLLNS